MSKSKPAALTSSNVRQKGHAQPAPDGVARGQKTPTAELVPLSFKVAPDFKKLYRLAAAEKGLRLNEVLFASFHLWRDTEVRKNGITEKA